ncbi:MAG: D-alanyl-D-alanine carboxypeptidase, partial [Alphaproteobacteria bacterium]|nr:D-alanyl-D-alanine carboxypeptidase [Alphaproteobacteria bacterium]
VLAGKTVTVDFALQSLLVYSANDMAYVLAEAVRPDWRDFVKDMNRTASQLGMTATHYVNPNGLFDPRQVTTARDIALLVTALLKDFPEYAHYFSQKTVAVGKRKLANRNALIRQMPDADGMKTGFVCNSGFNLVATATRDKRQLAAIVLGLNSGKARVDLAQMLLVDGFGRPTTGTVRPLAAIANSSLGSRLPIDMTKDVCRQKRGFMATYLDDVEGWGYSLGQYDTAQEADAVLRGLLLRAPGLDSGGRAGVIAMPGGKRFSALVWNLDQAGSLSACSAYRSANQTCEVMTPAFFGELASLAEKAAKNKKKSQAQGTGTTPTGKKKKKVTGQGN